MIIRREEYKLRNLPERTDTLFIPKKSLACFEFVAYNVIFACSGGWKNYNKSGVNPAAQQRRPKPPPKAQQLHYCDVCRISCAGPQVL